MSGRRRVRLPGRFLEGAISKYIMIRVEKICLCDFAHDDRRTGNHCLEHEEYLLTMSKYKPVKYCEKYIFCMVFNFSLVCCPVYYGQPIK